MNATRNAGKGNATHVDSNENLDKDQQQSPLIPCLFLPYTGQKSKLENQSKTMVDTNIGSFLSQRPGRKSDMLNTDSIDDGSVDKKQSNQDMTE